MLLHICSPEMPEKAYESREGCLSAYRSIRATIHGFEHGTWAVYWALPCASRNVRHAAHRQHPTMQLQPGHSVFIIDDAHLTAIAADSARRASGRQAGLTTQDLKACRARSAEAASHATQMRAPKLAYPNLSRGAFFPFCRAASLLLLRAVCAASVTSQS